MFTHGGPAGGPQSSGVDPLERVSLGRTALSVTRLGFGAASIGGLYEPVDEAAALETIRHAWAMGIRYFDVAPLYGYGNSELRLGRILAAQDRDDFVLSTKVGRVLRPIDEVAADPGLDRDRQSFGGVDDYFYKGTPPVRPVFDYSYDGTMRSVEASLRRLGTERIDILYIHDPDDHWEAAIGGAYPALHRLRGEGVVGAIGAGMNQAEMLARFAREGDFDAFLCAGRYTLLDHSALAELLPLALEKHIAIVIGGVMNSGLLVDPRPGAHFDYVPAERHRIDRALRLKAVCERYGVPLRAAALQFVFAHPAVVSVVAGVRRASHLDDTASMMRFDIPDDLWHELRAEGLLPAAAPVPSTRRPDVGG